MDTDSIVTNILLPNNTVSNKEIGKFKLEHIIKKAIFISNKTYCLLTNEDKIIIKSKGVINNKLSIKDFENMYYNKLNIKTLKNDTKTYYSKGYVDINTKEAILNYDSYKKRDKIYNNKRK
jgi:hypothetical protein